MTDIKAIVDVHNQQPDTLESLRRQLFDVCEKLARENDASLKLMKQLAECQAREKVLREKVVYALSLSSFVTPQNSILMEAVSLPSDSTALDAMLERVKREWYRKVIADVLTNSQDTVLKQAIEDEKINPWKQVIIDGLVVCGILKKEHEDTPSVALNDLICWSIDVALDPAVSSLAATLQRQWQYKAVLEVADWLEEGAEYSPLLSKKAHDLRNIAEALK